MDENTIADNSIQNVVPEIPSVTAPTITSDLTPAQTENLLQPIALPEIKEIPVYDLPSGKYQAFLSDLKNLVREVSIYYSPVIFYVLYQLEALKKIDTGTLISLSV